VNRSKPYGPAASVARQVEDIRVAPYSGLFPQAATNLGGQTRHQLGLMVKVSDNEMASKFSQEMGLRQIQEILNSYHFYDEDHGGGIWIGLTSPFTVVRKEHDDADDVQKGAKTGVS